MGDMVGRGRGDICLDKLHKAYEYLELARLNLFKEMDDRTGRRAFKRDNLPGVPGGTCTWDGSILQFMIPEVLPKTDQFHKYNTMSREIEDLWQGYMFHAFESTGMERGDVVFPKAFCLIQMYIPYSGRWDPENRAISHIINGLRYLRVVGDDGWKHLAHMVEGFADHAKPRVEVFITDRKNAANLIAKLCHSGNGDNKDVQPQDAGQDNDISQADQASCNDNDPPVRSVRHHGPRVVTTTLCFDDPDKVYKEE